MRIKGKKERLTRTKQVGDGFKLSSSGKKASTSIIVAIFALAMLFVLPMSAASPSSAYSTTSNYPVEATISWVFVPGTAITSSFYIVTANGIALQPLSAPNQVLVHFSAWSNGKLYFSSSCIMTRSLGLTYLPCAVTIPYEAGGSLTLGATFTNNSGQIVAQGIIDPLLEPSWN